MPPVLKSIFIFRTLTPNVHLLTRPTHLKRKLIFIPRKKSLTSHACQLQRKLILNMRGNDAIRACIKYLPCKVLINLS